MDLFPALVKKVLALFLAFTHGYIFPPKRNSGPLSYERLSENGPVLKSHLDSNLSSRSGESAQRWKFSTTGLDFLLRDKGKMNLQKCFLFVTGPVQKNIKIQRQGGLTWEDI